MRLPIRMLLAFCFIIFSVSVFAQSSVYDDTLITAKIKSKIAVDKSLSVFTIGVYTRNGVVKLDGEVNSDTDASALVELAESTNGVKDVDASSLSVKKSNSPLSDTIITAKIKGLYIKNKLFNDNVSAMTIQVETNNGVVHLSGTADNQDQIDNAIRIAKSVRGVKAVESRVQVK